MREKLIRIFESFVLFSFLGWIYESVWCEMIENNHGFVNRGVLFGPWLPIYGTGIIIILFVLKKAGIQKPLMIFCTATCISAVVELIGSYIMEILVGSFAWDYSDMFGNYQGRIAVKPDMMFGFLTLIAVYGVIPYLKEYQEGDQKKRMACDAAVLILLVIDIGFFIIKIIT